MKCMDQRSVPDCVPRFFRVSMSLTHYWVIVQKTTILTENNNPVVVCSTSESPMSVLAQKSAGQKQSRHNFHAEAGPHLSNSLIRRVVTIRSMWFRLHKHKHHISWSLSTARAKRLIWQSVLCNLSHFHSHLAKRGYTFRVSKLFDTVCTLCQNWNSRFSWTTHR